MPPYHPANRVLERSKVKPFNSLKPELNDVLVKLFVVKLVFQAEHPFIDKPIVSTEHAAVPSERLQGLGSKLYPIHSFIL